jgi:hypothetical protein
MWARAADLSRGRWVLAEQDAYLGVLNDEARLNLARILAIGAGFAALAVAATARVPAAHSGR